MSPPPIIVHTTQAAFFFKKKTIYRSLPPPKILGQKAKSNHNELSISIRVSDVEVLSKFAQLEYKMGEPERGKTMFENILSSYPKRTDLWSVYIDMTIKMADLSDVRYDCVLMVYSHCLRDRDWPV